MHETVTRTGWGRVCAKLAPAYPVDSDLLAVVGPAEDGPPHDDQSVIRAADVRPVGHHRSRADVSCADAD
jgi:hypothetical protein